MELTSCFAFDLDGTLANIDHRLHHIKTDPKKWDEFFADCTGDTPIKHICTLAQMLSYDNQIVIITGRPDTIRKQTEEWLDFEAQIIHDAIYMREANDHRPDHIVKSELFDLAVSDGFIPIMIFEDRKQVVDMWRKRNVPCAQVAEGEF